MKANLDGTFKTALLQFMAIKFTVLAQNRKIHKFIKKSIENFIIMKCHVIAVKHVPCNFYQMHFLN